ncbi:MAG: dipeptide epimerase [Sphingomonadales bacterium]|nr:dipeptide epimerase [Sphingomonadales bacterium]
MTGLRLDVRVEKFRLAAPFRISGYVFEEQNLVVVEIGDGEHVGRGEASGVYYLGDDADHMVAEIERVRAEIEAGITRAALQHIMPVGGGRNAVDAALWDLEAKRSGMHVWELLNMAPLKPLVTTFTLGAESPTQMAAQAVKFDHAVKIKVKLTGELDLDIERVRAIRAARPEVWLGVDGNQGFDAADLPELVQELVYNRVSLLEQPLKRGAEADLDGFKSIIPIAADESILSLAEVPSLVGRFDVVNIKLDKCGGLTEALAIAKAARDLGLGVMVGNMVGTSLGMAPAFLLGQLCDLVDLDGPIFLAEDREPGLVYAEGKVWCPEAVWGAPAAMAAA